MCLLDGKNNESRKQRNAPFGSITTTFRRFVWFVAKPEYPSDFRGGIGRYGNFLVGRVEMEQLSPISDCTGNAEG